MNNTLFPTRAHVVPVILLCLTLGLAPFFPEPHIWGKIRWIIGGAKGMRPIDWFDTLLHGTPWLLLLGLIGWAVFARRQKHRRSPNHSDPSSTP